MPCSAPVRHAACERRKGGCPNRPGARRMHVLRRLRRRLRRARFCPVTTTPWALEPGRRCLPAARGIVCWSVATPAVRRRSVSPHAPVPLPRSRPILHRCGACGAPVRRRRSRWPRRAGEPPLKLKPRPSGTSPAVVAPRGRAAGAARGGSPPGPGPRPADGSCSVLVQECDGTRSLMASIDLLQAVPGVITVNLVYHHVERQEPRGDVPASEPQESHG